MNHPFLPKLFTSLREGYTGPRFLNDVVAGTIVGIVALPLAIAFAIASGVKPEQGILTAILGGFIVGVFGGSRVQIAGPTGAFIIIVYRIVHTYGYEGLAAATLIAGAILIIMGIARFGTLLRFVPYPLTVGFTSGIALIILLSQIPDLVGLPLRDVPADAVEKLSLFARTMGSADLHAIGVGAASLLILILWPRVTQRIPGSLVAIVAVTAVVQFWHLPVETIGSRFGAVPSTIPSPHLPDVSWETLRRLFPSALTIAMLGAIESLLSAVVADGMIRGRHRSNMELIAQGTANIVSPLFGGIPVTGAIARTATNVRNGGRTPVSAIVHSVVLLLIMLVFGRWAKLIPLATLAAILVVVAYHMSEWRSFLKILRSPRSDVAVMLSTFALTVFVDLTTALQVGVILSALLFIKRMAEVSQVTPLTRDLREEGDEETGPAGGPAIPDDVEVFEVYGSLFFGAVDQFTEAIRSLRSTPRVFILETHSLLAIDASGLRALEELHAGFTSQGTRLVIAGIHKQPLFALQQSGLIEKLGEENICGDLEEALERAGALPAKAS